MHGIELWLSDQISTNNPFHQISKPIGVGGLFLEQHPHVSKSFLSFVVSDQRYGSVRWVGGGGGRFLSVSLSGYGRESGEVERGNGEKGSFRKVVKEEEFNGALEKSCSLVSGVDGGGGFLSVKGEGYGSGEIEEQEEVNGALNTTKHLWAGAVAAMVSRTIVAPLERLKLEYMVRGETKPLFELVAAIGASQGLKGFWKGNFVNILRTAPFKAINFYAYDTYKNQLLKISGNDETTNFERFVAGAAAGITATVLCIPMDTIRTVMVAPGGEALGGIIGAFRHMIKTEGFFSLYKGLGPSIISMAPSGAVFYGVYDILKSTYLHSPKGIKRTQEMEQLGDKRNALEQLELGTLRTLVYGAIAGACAEAATYPFEVVRRQLQMQVRETKMSAIATCVKLVEQGGVPSLYAGLTPSLLQVLPSAAISYFVYESHENSSQVE